MENTYLYTVGTYLWYVNETSSKIEHVKTLQVTIKQRLTASVSTTYNVLKSNGITLVVPESDLFPDSNSAYSELIFRLTGQTPPQSATPTPTPTVTPSITPSGTPEVTPSPTPEATPTVTPTVTPTPSAVTGDSILTELGDPLLTETCQPIQI